MGTPQCAACRLGRKKRAHRWLQLHVSQVYAAFEGRQPRDMVEWLKAWPGGEPCPDPAALLEAIVSPLLFAARVAVRSPEGDGRFMLRLTHAPAHSSWRFNTAADARKTFIELVLRTPALLLPGKLPASREAYVAALQALSDRGLLQPAVQGAPGCALCREQPHMTARVKVHLAHVLRTYGSDGEAALHHVCHWMEDPDRQPGCPTASALVHELAERGLASCRILQSNADGTLSVREAYAGTLEFGDGPLHRARFADARLARSVYFRLLGLPERGFSTTAESLVVLRAMAGAGAWRALDAEAVMEDRSGPRKRVRADVDALAAEDARCAMGLGDVDALDALHDADELWRAYQAAGCEMDATPLLALRRAQASLGDFQSMADVQRCTVWYCARDGRAHLLQLRGRRLGPFATMRLSDSFLRALPAVRVCCDASKPLPPLGSLAHVVTHHTSGSASVLCVTFHGGELCVYERPAAMLLGSPVAREYVLKCL